MLPSPLANVLFRVLGAATEYQFAIAVIFVALIAALAIAWLVHYLCKLRRIRRSIEEVLARWGEVDSPGFREQLPKIHGDLSNHPYLAHAWKEFKETFLYPDDDEPEQDQVVSNTIDAAAFFNEDTILSPVLDLSFVRNVPNILTGLGILGTFLGLVLGLWGARDIIEDPGKIEALLHGAFLAFLTSLAGLFFSILFSLVVNPSLHRLSRTLGHLVTFLDSRVRRLTVERLSRDLLVEARRQSRSLEHFTTDVAIAIGDRVTEGMDARLVPVLKDLSAAVRQTLDRERESIAETLREVVRDLHQAATRAVREQMESLARNLETIGKKLDEVTVSLGQGFAEAGQRFQEKIDTAAGTVGKTVQDTLAVIDTFTKQISEQLGGATEALVAATVALEEKRTALEKTAHDLSPVLATLREALPPLAQVTERLAGSAEQLLKLPEEIRPLVEAMRQGIEELRTTSGALRQLLAAAQEAIGRIEEAWREQAQRFEQLAERYEGVDERLAAVFRQVDEGLGGYRDAVATFHRELDDNVAKITGALANIAEELAVICDRLGND